MLPQALFNLLIRDHAADAFSPPRLSESGLCDWLVEWLLGGLSRWDAEHFLFIAEHGYMYEHNCAFFPLFPLSLRAAARMMLWPLEGLLCFRSQLLLSAALLNTVFSVLASWILYELGCVVLQCRRQAFLSAILFCVTPANVFMAAAYSESMFALLAFGAMWQLEKGWLWTSTLLFSLASGVRSNGMINAGFLLYSQTKRFVSQLQKGTGVALLLILSQLPILAVSVALMCTFIFLPFALFQFYAYFWFCSGNVGSEYVVPKPLLQLAVDMGYHLAFLNGAKPSWCSWDYPIAYAYIQDAYWNVGFLRYYEAKQIPNFLLAAPAIMLGSWAALCYVASNPWHCLTLGLARRETGRTAAESSTKPTVGFCSPGVLVYIIHSTALLIFGTFCMHIQVRDGTLLKVLSGSVHVVARWSLNERTRIYLSRARLVNPKWLQIVNPAPKSCFPGHAETKLGLVSTLHQQGSASQPCFAKVCTFLICALVSCQHYAFNFSKCLMTDLLVC